MATKLKFPKEALLRYLSIYISIAENKDTIKLYVGKTGDNRDGCNPIISRIGNHFSFNPIHSQIRNKIKNHEEWDFTFIFENIEKYDENSKDRKSQIDYINEMKRWANEKLLIVASSFKNCEFLNPLKVNLKFLSKKYSESFYLRDTSEHAKINTLISDVYNFLLENQKPLFKPKISLLFLFEPNQWGLRGDKHLWKEITFNLLNTDLPSSFDTTEKIITDTILKLTNKDIYKVEDFYIKKYDHGGMSNGRVSSEFWNKDGKNFLNEKFEIISRIQNSS